MKKTAIHWPDKSVLPFLLLMTILSFSNLFRIRIGGDLLKLAGLAVILGVIAFFVTRKTNDSKEEGLDFKTFPGQLKNKKAVLLLVAPILVDALTFVIFRAFLPEYFDFLMARLPFAVNASMIPMILVELLVLPLGEEIAMRAFYQKQLAKTVGARPALILTSMVFAVAHFSFGSPLIVFVDLAGVFVNAIFYGLLFQETDNAWCSWVSHSAADIVAICTVAFLL
ncbi:MAG: CPBP family intramembrane metalloprotease [Lachnospiraceae bacterium]|nr:CPBP family intramembrane metalloprotease [Lachnospiraceae bacterium]